MRFSLGVNYWPRGSALAMWRRFDATEIAEDFARIAALGLDSVRFFLCWDDFQPAPDAVDPLMLNRLEAVVATAHDAGLRVVPVLFSGHLAGVTRLPAWASGLHDLYGGALLDAQLAFARAAGERLREHPALHAWDIGHAFTAVSQPSRARASAGEHSPSLASEATTAQWAQRITAALRETSPTGTTAGTYSDDLTFDRGVRLASLCTPFAFASMQGTAVRLPFARSRLDPEAIPFLAMLAAAFSHKPVTVTAFGNPTCPADKFSAFERFAMPGEPPNMTIAPNDTVFSTYPCLTEDENARWCTAVLERLHADGRLGAYWWCWADATADQRGLSPFDRAPEQGSFGIIRADGTDKPVAAALAAFARDRREITEAHDMPAISADYYYRTLPKSTATLYQAYLSFIEERRTAV